jgi:hypothetical protein
MLLRNHAPQRLLSKGAEILKCDVASFQDTLRIRDDQKENRGLLIYLLWEMGLYKNEEIGKLSALGTSSVSRRASAMKSELAKNRKLQNKYQELKALIKM